MIIKGSDLYRMWIFKLKPGQKFEDLTSKQLLDCTLICVKYVKQKVVLEVQQLESDYFSAITTLNGEGAQSSINAGYDLAREYLPTRWYEVLEENIYWCEIMAELKKRGLDGKIRNAMFSGIKTPEITFAIARTRGLT